MGRVWLRPRSACPPLFPVPVCGVGVRAGVWVSAAPRLSLGGCWGVCVLVRPSRVVFCTSWLGLVCRGACLCARPACSPPFLAGVWCVGVRAGPGSPLCRALLGLVVGVCFLRFFFGVSWFGFVVSVAGCTCPRPCDPCPPIPFLSGWAAGSFFFFARCVSACFGVPFPAGPLFLACCCRFWLGGPPVPLWGSCLRCLLGWGLGCLLWCWRAVWWLWAVLSPPPPSPPCFFFWGGAWLFLPLPSLGWRTHWPGGLCCVHAQACVQCVGGAFGCLSSPFWAWFGGSVWVWGLCVVALLPSRLWGLDVVPRPPWLGSVGGVSPRRPLCVPSPPFVSLPRRLAVFPWCLARAFPAVVGGGGGPCRRLGFLPLVFPLRGADACTPRQGVTVLYGPFICTRLVQMDLLRSQVLQPFPTPRSGTLWVAGESLRDRCASCLPRWTMCPTRSPLLGPNHSTCRGGCSSSGPLVTPPGRCHRGPLTKGPGRIPPYCVCSSGAHTVTGGAPKPLRLGPSPASPVGPFCPATPFAVWFAVVGFSSLPGGVVVVGDAFRFFWPCCLCACPHLPWLWFAAGGGR